MRVLLAAMIALPLVPTLPLGLERPFACLTLLRDWQFTGVLWTGPVPATLAAIAMLLWRKGAVCLLLALLAWGVSLMAPAASPPQGRPAGGNGSSAREFFVSC